MMAAMKCEDQARQADLQWLYDEFTRNLWQVHHEFCTDYGPNDCCEQDQKHLEQILQRLGWIKP